MKIFFIAVLILIMGLSFFVLQIDQITIGELIIIDMLGVLGLIMLNKNG